MSLQSSRGSFCSLLGLYFCSSGWVGVSAGAGQNKEVRGDEVLSALPLLLLLLAACPAPAVPECPLKVAHATSFMSPWAGVKLHSPSLAAWKGSNQGTVRHQKKKRTGCLWILAPWRTALLSTLPHFHSATVALDLLFQL